MQIWRDDYFARQKLHLLVFQVKQVDVILGEKILRVFSDVDLGICTK
jgi:hypothetical protein